jgi:membrane-associated protease RseP (regulator of RpoE activity)
MVDTQTWIAIVFISIMSLVLYKHRKKIQTNFLLGPLLYFVMLKTKLGLNAMDYLGTKWRGFFKAFGYFSIVIGFLGMILITYQLVKSTILLFILPQTAPGIQPVLPFQAKGVFFVPFSYWIISIFVIAVLHEFFHGVLARAHNIKVKSSGFAFLGAIVPIIPAAFVEPDEKVITKRPASQQLSVFAAGPVANIVMAILMVFAFGIDASPLIPYSVTKETALWDITEAGTSIITFSGLTINDVAEGSPAARAGLRVGDTITALNNVPVTERDKTLETITSLKANQNLLVHVDSKAYNLVLDSHQEDPARGYIGIGFDTETMYDSTAVAKHGEWGVKAIHSLVSLLIWIFVLSLGIGLFNLIPLGPIDGGRMFKLALERLTKNKTRGHHVWKWVSFAILGMIIVNLVIGFVR